MHLKEIVEKAHSNAKNKGFWEDWERIHEFENLIVINISKDGERQAEIDKNNAISTRLMLIVSEVSEALEALREDNLEEFKEELADVIIRTCDLAGGLSIDLEAEVIKKMQKNEKRAFKHGKLF